MRRAAATVAVSQYTKQGGASAPLGESHEEPRVRVVERTRNVACIELYLASHVENADAACLTTALQLRHVDGFRIRESDAPTRELDQRRPARNLTD